MYEQQVVREAPINPPLTRAENDPTRPAVPDEPVLNIKNIQGNIIGFNKDQQTLLFLKVTDPKNFRAWLGALVPFIATAAEVLSFNRLFKEIRRRRKAETRTVQATWVNVALSFNALQQLTSDPAAIKQHADKLGCYNLKDVDDASFSAGKFIDEAFRNGMQARAVDILGDPKDSTINDKPVEGNPANWTFGGPGNEADVVIIVASDSTAELAAEVARIEESIYSGRSSGGEHANSGVQIIYKQQGQTLPPPLTGHEHFGFLDGVSQPGLRGRLSEDLTDVLTPRQNPQDANQGKPGQDLIWPGEFIFGYPEQIGEPEAGEDELNTNPGEPSEAGPVWGKDGSFFVVRRLRQNVEGFHRFLEVQAQALGISSDLLGAKLVGRWKSGAPILREPDQDEPRLGNDDCANNHFEFQDASKPIPKQPDPNDPTCALESAFCVDDNDIPQSPGDPPGARCPFAGHIRKTYPRDDVVEGDEHGPLNESSTQTHRLLRRGIPFGQPFFPSPDPTKIDSGNRGLVFAAYQTSIVDQFEFVTQHWVNNPDFKEPAKDGKLRSGHDFIIGQSNGEDGSRERQCRITFKKGGTEHEEVITAPVDWVIPTGGGYFFAPSIDALCLLTGIERS